MRIVSLLPAMLALSVAGCVFTSFGDLTRRGADRPPPERCGECHREIYAEWSASAHARSYVDPDFATYSSAYTFETCLPCHAPDSLYTPGRLQVRTTGRKHGVDCVACHLDGAALVGPLASTAVISPHPFRQDRESYRKSDMCGRCHEGTFAQWRAASRRGEGGDPGVRKRECQECHMPCVARTVTQADDRLSSVLVGMETVSRQRRHVFDLAAMQGFEGAADVRVVPTPSGPVLEVVNHLPHTLPTGDYGPSRLEARMVFRDASNAVIARRVLSWSGRLSSAIPAYGRDRKALPLIDGARRCEVVLLRPGGRDAPDLVLGRCALDLR